MRCNFYLRKPGSKIKGRSAIYMSATYRGQRCILFPGESIDKEDWDNKKFKPKPVPVNNALIGRLNRFEQLVRDTHDDLQKTSRSTVSADTLKKSVNAVMHPANNQSTDKTMLIADFFQRMIDDTRNKTRLGKNGKVLTEATIGTYETTKSHFENFQSTQRRKYSLDKIDQKLIDDFSDYLNINLKMAFNASGKYMKTFRVMMNYARQIKLVGMDTILDNKVTVTKETPDNIYLTEQEITDMLNLKDFRTPLYEIVRDYFVIGCKTGLRFSDYSRLSTAHIDIEFIRTNQKKVSERVTVPIHPIVAQIFAKYKDGLPKCPCNQVFNDYLKDIGKMLPALDKDFEKTLTRSRKSEAQIFKKWQLLQTHTGRRSFATNEYLAGTPVIAIMAITGHKTEKSFKSYIKADALQHAMLVRDRWKANGK